jgi:hypothetical protein
MKPIYLVHIIAGTLGLVSGFIALYAAKGARVHRRAGMFFVSVMLTMCVAGLTMALGRNVAPSVNVPAALITAYLVVTSLATVKPPSRGGRLVHFGGMALVLAVVIADAIFAIHAVNGHAPDGMPAFPFFMFGIIGLLGLVGDARVLVAEPLKGAPRLARHLWRMCMALFIASLSFFIGQSDEFPEALRIMPLLASPLLIVLVTMFYWLWRISIRRSLRGVVEQAASRTVPVHQ